MTNEQLEARKQEVLKTYHDWKAQRVARGDLPISDSCAPKIMDCINTYFQGVVNPATLEGAAEMLIEQDQIVFELSAAQLKQVNNVIRKTNETVQAREKAQADLDAKAQADAEAARILEARNLRQSRQDHSGPGRQSAGDSAKAAEQEKIRQENERRQIVSKLESAASRAAFLSALQQARLDAHSRVHSQKQDRFNELAVALRNRWPEYANEIVFRP